MINRIYKIMITLLLLFIIPAHAAGQEFVKKIEFDGKPINSIFTDGFESGNLSRLDCNGDGNTDRVFFTEVSGLGMELAILIGGNGKDILWKIPLNFLQGDPDRPIFIGAFNMDGIVDDKNPKEIVLARKQGRRFKEPIILSLTVELENVRISSVIGLEDDYNNDGVVDARDYLVGMADTNNDNKTDIIVADLTNKIIQVWGFE